MLRRKNNLLKSSISLSIVFLVSFSIFSCKNKPKKKLEELPTKVEVFSPEKYKSSRIDSADLVLLKRFGSEYDSTAFFKDLDSISTYIQAQNLEEVFYTNSGVAYAVKKYGRGNYPMPYDQLHVQVETKRWDGKILFSTEKYKQPLSFTLGVGQVVPAWDEVLINVPEGSELIIISPSAMSYGKKNIPRTLPGNSLLIYDVTIEKVIPPDNDADNAATFKVNNNIDEKEDNKIPITIRKPTKPSK